ncbi:MAG: CarD family transcriptional regulator [Acetivibrio sp.]
MFKIGDYIIYGSYGVCKVEKIGFMEESEVQKDKLYYTLIPLYSKGSKVYTPTDNKKVVMRAIISKEEALKLIEDIKDIETFSGSDDKKAEIVYKEALRKCDCRESVKIIKTLYLKRELRTAEGKNVTISDKKYLKLAEESLFGELAIPLNIDIEEVEKFILKSYAL